jgi:hypothetical protein
MPATAAPLAQIRGWPSGSVGRGRGAVPVDGRVVTPVVFDAAGVVEPPALPDAPVAGTSVGIGTGVGWSVPSLSVRQVPLTQVSPSAHRTLQPPQFATSRVVSRQSPKQAVRPSSHGTHAWSRQPVPGGQQTPPQTSTDPGHWHAPSMHTEPPRTLLQGSTQGGYSQYWLSIHTLRHEYPALLASSMHLYGRSGGQMQRPSTQIECALDQKSQSCSHSPQ